VRSLLVTNDFPPKVGGIQSYLWELWRRLPPEQTTVLTTPHRGAAAFDADQPFRVVRTEPSVLLPTTALRRRIDRLAGEVDADLVVLDPAVPLGLLGPRLHQPYGVVVHGAEITVPGRTPGGRRLLGGVLRGATVVVAAGAYPADEAERAADRGLPVVVVPPGVDVDRFVPLAPERRVEVRRRLGLAVDATLVTSVSRLVPRKGMDTLVRAAAALAPQRPELTVAIGGSGRDRRRLDRLVRTTGAPVQMLGRVADEDLADLYGCADVFAMLCRDRWAGREQEGFGIVFLEAAACGVAQVAGASGGAAEAVVDGETGLVVDRPTSVHDVAEALSRLMDHPAERAAMGAAARRRAKHDFGYDLLADRLHAALAAAAARP